jgi:hypothetical protein
MTEEAIVAYFKILSRKVKSWSYRYLPSATYHLRELNKNGGIKKLSTGVFCTQTRLAAQTLITSIFMVTILLCLSRFSEPATG